MANITRVKVEIKKKYNDPHKNFKEMFQEFKRRVSNAKIMHDYKDHQYFESKTERKRKKKRDAIKKFQMEQLAEKILSGERVKAPSGLIKKVLSAHKKDKKKEKDNSRRGSYEK
jgi:ribosomal protein S21